MDSLLLKEIKITVVKTQDQFQEKFLDEIVQQRCLVKSLAVADGSEWSLTSLTNKTASVAGLMPGSHYSDLSPRNRRFLGEKSARFTLH